LLGVLLFARTVPLTSSPENEGIARRLAPNIYQLQYDIEQWVRKDD